MPGTVVAAEGVPGPTAFVPELKSEADLERARGTADADRAPFKAYQIV